jgi:hypothetical protein
MIGAPYHPAGHPPYGGRAFVFSTGTGALLRTFDGTDPIGESAKVVASAGDVDQDGIDDLIVGAPEVNLASFNSGKITVYSGATGAALWVAAGDLEDELFGTDVTLAADLDHDGIREIFVGSRGRFGVQGWAQGAVSILSGATGQSLLLLEGEEPQDGFGISIAPLSDVNGDGAPDLAVGAWGYDGAAGFETGKVYVELLDPAQFLMVQPRGRIVRPQSKTLESDRPSFLPVFRGRIDLENEDDR